MLRTLMKEGDARAALLSADRPLGARASGSAGSVRSPSGPVASSA